MWQPTHGVEPQQLQQRACGSGTEKAEAAAQCLRALSMIDPTSDDAIPDGLVPHALREFIEYNGTPAGERVATVAAIVQAQLRAVMAAAKQRALQVAHHWQLVGVPLVGVGQVRHPELANCHVCSALRRNLYLIKRSDGEAEAQIIDNTCSRMIEHLTAQLDGGGADRARSTLQSSLQSEGAHICFECAVPVLAQRFKAKHANTQRRDDQPANLEAAASHSPGDEQQCRTSVLHTFVRQRGWRKPCLVHVLTLDSRGILGLVVAHNAFSIDR